MGIVAGNTANADTPGYKARDLPDFARTYSGMRQGEGQRATRPGHINSPARNMQPEPEIQQGPASVNGNTVSLEGEMVRAADIRQQQDLALSVYRSSASILRLALGRGR